MCVCVCVCVCIYLFVHDNFSIQAGLDDVDINSVHPGDIRVNTNLPTLDSSPAEQSTVRIEKPVKDGTKLSDPQQPTNGFSRLIDDIFNVSKKCGKI